MALVNPQIAMSYRPTVEYQPRNALAEYAQIQQIAGAQTQQDLARMQMDKIRRMDEAMERIRQVSMQHGGPDNEKDIALAFMGSPDFQHQQLGVSMLQRLQGRGQLGTLNKELGLGVSPSPAAAAAPETAPAAASAGELVARPMAPSNIVASDIPPMGAAAPTANALPAAVGAAAPAAVPTTNAMLAPAAQPVAPGLSGKTVPQLQQSYLDASRLVKLGVEGAQGTLDLVKQELERRNKLYEVKGRLITAEGKEAYAAPPEPTNIAVLEREVADLVKQGVPANDPRIVARQSAIAQAAGQTDPLVKQYEYAVRQGFTGSLFDYKRQIAQAGRAITPPAPSVTQIVDPTDPNKMLVVDTRRYQGGGAGSPGVIGVGGKEPSAALRTNKIEEGKSQLQNDLDNLRSSFTELNRLRAIPSTERGTVSNLMSAAQASGTGQVLGRATGTKEQVERDVINSARQRLVASIKNATGMSAKSLDSNMELQTMLRSISDPGQSFEAAMRIIDDIEDAYVRGVGAKNKPAVPETTAPAAPAAAQGAGGFRYLGKEGK